MKTRKKCYQSYKFWITSLLALSATSIFASLVLTSCTVNVTKNEDITSDVVISKEPDKNQEVSTDSESGLTLSIDAKSTKGKELKYQWYQDKNDNKGWTQIAGATSSTYNVPSEELKEVTTETTWQYKVEIKYQDGSTDKLESSVYTIKVKPADNLTNTITFTTDLPKYETIVAGDKKVFNVLASTNISNASITYDWYLDKGTGTATKVLSSTSNTYTLESDETSNIIEKKDWSLYVIAYPNSNDNLTVTSNICTITINPKNSSDTQKPKGTISFANNLDLTTNITAGSSITFTVQAITQNISNPTIAYEWFLDKNSNGTYVSVKNSTDNTYTISNSETSSIEITSTWKLYVKAYATNDDTIVTTSNICTITINPKTLDGIIPPTEVINPREYNINGLTTVKYPQEKWIGNNEVSITINSTPKIEYLKTFVDNYLKNNSSDKDSTNTQNRTAYIMIKDLETALSKQYYNTYSLTGGTGWMLDYSINPNNENLVNYYLATNIHVLEASYSLRYRVNLLNGSQASVNVIVPLSEQTASSVDVYLSQPQYSETNANNNLKIPYGSQYDTAWHKTPITITNLKDNLIPIGAYTSSGTLSTTTPYMMQISYSFNTSFGRQESSYYFPSSGITGSGIVNASIQQANDIAVLKFSDSKDSFSKFKIDTKWTTMFQKMQTMFNVETDNSKVSKNSSYIARLNALLSLVSSENYSKEKVKELFMFADYKKDITTNTVVSVAGFPATSYGGNYINFNSNTLSYSLISKPTISDHESRSTIEYNYRGNMYYSKYSWDNEFLMPKLDLMGGSSGSMTVDQDYKIIGIYWGVLEYRDTNTGSIIINGISTELYSYVNSNSILMKWLKYVQINDQESKLNKLFSKLKTLGYFE